MPQALVLIPPEWLTPERLTAHLPASWTTGVMFVRPDGVQLQGPAFAWCIDLSVMTDPDFSREDYETNEDVDPEFRRQVRGCIFFLVNFDDFTVVRRFIAELLEALPGPSSQYWIDDDYGRVWRGDRFLAKLQVPEWDWRTDQRAP
ncbi:hypothetical protein [Pyxidicoccus xibeiensis]|uniref:hypothetical protein n=1 Tax=Pyxidicoccus xibeiensis TaxID=2906759 RepID=UPI0020A742DC|nr:hypothetical protein [Pyxidicoccus xibeiensis]MCP3143172.1 hypothetical protein [Pyxidicoccus xibeiensis]